MSGSGDTAQSAVSRTKDGIPIWGGEAGSFVQYEEAALLWEQSLTWEKRYTAGPRLVQELTGAARRLVAGQPAGWVAYRGGVTTLMDHLRKALGKPRVNEVTDLLAAYFKGTKRKSQESMNEYITRKFEAFMRASQAMKRVAPFYESDPREGYPEVRPWSRRTSVESSQWGWNSGSQGPDPEAGTNPGPAPSEGPGDAATEATSTSPSTTWPDSQWQSRNSGWSGWHDWRWGPSWYGSGGTWDWSSSSASTSSYSERPGHSQELLPSFIQGWYMLADAGLDNNERNLVMTAINGNFSPHRVAQELRNQFPEGEVRRRDQGRGFRSYVGELVDEDEEPFDMPGYSMDELIQDGMNEEGAALIAEAENEAQEALAAMFQAKRTLKDARQKQHLVKQSRKYYRTSFTSGRSSSSGGSGRTPDDSQMECLRCGKKGHRAANCPHKPIAAQTDQPRGPGDGEPQQAPFVCYAHTTEGPETFSGFAQMDVLEQAFHVQDGEGLTTQEAVDRGLCVIDGGATQTIGSVHALEAVLRHNQEKYGKSKLRGVNNRDPPRFSFGNSTENRCLSTATLGVMAGGMEGEINIHTLEGGTSPILLSVDALRRLGAIIDFQEDLAVFKQLSSTKIVRLSRGKTGHQMMPLTDDWLEGALPAGSAVPHLSAFLKP